MLVQNLHYIIFIIILSAVSAFSAEPAAIDSINDTAARIKDHISYLASDELEGRGTGTAGEQKAAKYISDFLGTLNLVPIGDRNTYYQNIPMHGSVPLKSSQLHLTTETNEYKFKLHDDYLLYKSGAQTFIPASMPLVFAGYGINAPEYSYNDYLTIDVKGKVAVMLEGEPQSKNPDYFMGSSPTIHSYPEAKQRTAISQGAAGSIIISLPSKDSDKRWQHLQREFSFEDITLAYRVTGNLGILLHSSQAYKLFQGSEYSIDDIRQMVKNNSLRSFKLNSAVSFKGRFKERDFFSANIAGLLYGSDAYLKDTYLIISAHYDHLGIGAAVDNDSIYNGLSDNALGVAAVLELIKLFSEDKNQPKRSILFLFTSGEEKGLLGSVYYTDHPLVPLYKTIANVNIDGLAVFDTFKDIVGVGSELSTLGEILEAVARLKNLQVSKIPPQFLSYESFARSDQMSFAKAGIPSILIMDGLQYHNLSPDQGLHRWLEWNNTIYHTPFDDLNQPVNFAAVNQHVKFLYDFCRQLSAMEQQPQWKYRVPFRLNRLQTIAEKR